MYLLLNIILISAGVTVHLRRMKSSTSRIFVNYTTSDSWVHWQVSATLKKFSPCRNTAISANCRAIEDFPAVRRSVRQTPAQSNSSANFIANLCRYLRQRISTSAATRPGNWVKAEAKNKQTVSEQAEFIWTSSWKFTVYVKNTANEWTYGRILC